MIVFDVLVQEQYQWKVKCSIEVHFSDMCWKIDGNCEFHYIDQSISISNLLSDNKPFFGPAYIYFYEGIRKNIFFGKLLISIETEDIDQRVAESLTHKQDILMTVNETDYWKEKVFKVNMVLVSMDAMNIQQSRMKIYLSCENILSNTIDEDVQNYDDVKMKVKFVHFDSNVRPLLTLSIKLPDNRLKLQLINLVQMLVLEMVREKLEKSFLRLLRELLNLLLKLAQRIFEFPRFSQKFAHFLS